MSEKFDYYYGEESESCSFYRIPRLLVVHCAAGAGGVTLSCSNGFTQAARPGWYGEE